MRRFGRALVLRTLLAATPVAILAFSFALPTSATAAPVEEVHPAKADGSVHVVAVETDIEVVGIDGTQLKIDGELADGATLNVVTSPGATRIEVVPPPDERAQKGERERSALVIQVPRRSAIVAKTVSGRLRMSAVEGTATLESVSGSVTVDGKPRELEAMSVSGSLYLVSASDRTRAKTVSGKIHVAGSRGKLEASSVSGKLEIEQARVSRCELSTVSGAIELDGVLLADGPHELKSHSGRITLTLPRDQPLEIEASSFSGTVRNKIDNDNRRGKSRISLGKDGPLVRVRTFSGGIVVQPK